MKMLTYVYTWTKKEIEIHWATLPSSKPTKQKKCSTVSTSSWQRHIREKYLPILARKELRKQWLVRIWVRCIVGFRIDKVPGGGIDGKTSCLIGNLSLFPLLIALFVDEFGNGRWNGRIFKIVKLRFAARRVDIVSLPSVTLSEAKSAHRGRAYRSREDLHSDTDVIGFVRYLLLSFNSFIKKIVWTLLV